MQIPCMLDNYCRLIERKVSTYTGLWALLVVSTTRFFAGGLSSLGEFGSRSVYMHVNLR